MLETRCFEEKIVDQYARGNVPGLGHLYIGEEAVAVGACTTLEKDDLITNTHRGHGHCILVHMFAISVMALFSIKS